MSAVSVEGVTLKLKPNQSNEDNTFLIKKLERDYHLKDIDKDGVVTKTDYIAWIEKAAKMVNVTFTDQMKNAAGNAFDALYGNAKNLTEWRTGMMSKLKSGGMTAEKHAKLLTPMFKAVDFNNNGIISWEEYRAISMALGHSASDAHYGFGMIDGNGDGVISYEEFCHAAHMYLTDTTDSKWKHFMGKWKEETTPYTAFQIEKMRRLYEKFDFNGDGYVKMEDYDLWMEKYAATAGFEITEDMRNAMKAHFDGFVAGTNNFDEWKDKFLAMTERSDFVEYAANATTSALDAFDVDKNGYISWREYRAMVCSLGASEAAAHYAFSRLDINGDGQLSLHEFAMAELRYFTDKGDTRFKHFYGEYLPDESFLVKKLKKHYQMIDLNGNGVVTKDDYVMWGKKAMTLQGASFTDEVKASWETAFDTLFGECKNFGEFRDHILNMHEKNPRMIADFRNLTVPIMKAMDINGNGDVEWEEYKSYVMAIGVTEAQAHVGFASIDDNGDGKIDFEELAYANFMYFTDRTDSIHKHFYGEWSD